MKIVINGPIPVIPPAPALAAADRRLQEQLRELSGLGSAQLSEAEMAWKQHKEENHYDNVVRPQFGTPIDPADRVRAYSRAARGK